MINFLHQAMLEYGGTVRWVGKPDDCARFGTQREFLERGFGAHKIYELDERSLKRFLSYRTEAARIMSTDV